MAIGKTAFGIVGINQHEFKQKLGLTGDQMHKFSQAWIAREKELVKLRMNEGTGQQRADRIWKDYRELVCASFELLHAIEEARGLVGKYGLENEILINDSKDPVLVAAFKLAELLRS